MVQQQARVLANNLADAPAVLYGNGKADLWEKLTWEKITEHNKVIVCTPAILDQSLMRSFITMEDISLLVFDEAHHVKKDHPYSRLIRSYYLKCPTELRPRIFGMTASPVDSKGDIAIKAKDLEDLLHAKIITTDDGSLLSFAPKPTDVIWSYPRPRTHFETDLTLELSRKVRFCQDLKQGFIFSNKAVTELGPWCADQVWKFVMGRSLNESSSVRKKFEQSEAYAKLSTIKEREQALVALDEAALTVQKHINISPSHDPAFLSSKVTMLYDKLTEHFANNPQTRAVVFVEERLKALVLHDCFMSLNIPNMSSGILLGIAGKNFEVVSVKHQERTLKQFREGAINLLFATSVADEGLDIPQCNLCIRFDLCKTTIQYIQSKGRARMKGSIFVHMVEEGNREHLADVDYQIQDEQYIKLWCASLQPDRRLGHGTQLAKLLSRDAKGKSFKTSAGAVCDNSNALLILARFAASLQHTGAADKETYEEEIDVEKNLFRYIVRLPVSEQCKLRGCRGEWKTNKQLAKRSAAWACCYLLRKHQKLDENLDSVFRKLKPDNLNARLAVSAKKSKYDMLVKPISWEFQLKIIPSKLFATILRFRPECHLKHDLSPIVVLTRLSLPTIPTFTAYMEDNIPTQVDSECVTTALALSKDELQQLTVFTLDGVFLDIFNKKYAIEPEKMSYWLAPMKRLVTLNLKSLRDLVDFPAMAQAQEERVKWKADSDPSIWTDKFICDPMNGRFHYFLGKVVPGAKITDPVPDYVPKIAQKSRQNIIDFSDSVWTASKKRVPAESKYDFNQPVFSAEYVGTRRNFLDPESTQDLTPCLIAPQPLEIARISPDFAASCLLWPALIHRIESYMLALELFNHLELPGIPADLALEALTKDADNEFEERQTHTGGTRGMGKNYERLEFIGDSLLKMTTTMTVFNRTACDEEGMHCRRMEIICNQNLFNVATSDDLQLFRYARTLGFDRGTWYPEFLTLLSGRGAQKIPQPVLHPRKTHDLGMKTIADISEAIIGAAITASNHLPLDKNRFDLGIKAITKLVRSEDHDVNSWSDIAFQYKVPDWSLQTNDPIANDRARMVAAKTGYQFKHARLLRSAFTHSSDMNSPVPDLQRLEFLGDALLDWVCISWLFNTNPTRNPQWLTEHKMAMVSNKFLAMLAVSLDFDKFIFATTAKLIGDIQIYATKVREALQQPECPRSFWTALESPPKALSDLVESYLGAVLIDSDFDYCEVERFFDSHVKYFFESISEYDTFANRQPTTYLFHRLARDFKCRDCRFEEMQNRDLGREDENSDLEMFVAVCLHGKILADDKGTGIRYAKTRASKKALAILEGMTRDEFRQAYSCDCIEKAH